MPTALPTRPADSSHASSAPRDGGAGRDPARRRPRGGRQGLFPHRRRRSFGDHARLLWGYDDKGSEFYTLRVRDMASGHRDLDDVVADTGGDGVWDAPGTTASSTRGSMKTTALRSSSSITGSGTNPAVGPAGLRRSRSGLLHERVGGSRNNDWIIISINDHETSEYRLMPADRPDGTPMLVARETGMQYDLEEGGDVFFVLTNADGAKDFQDHDRPGGRPDAPQTGPNSSRTSPAASSCP
jgi:oligopeptidase B